ncbi:hypothetical protein H4R33_003229 [Dimargaris cristalligena]|uniref:MoaB/Mog domain-containing protein n=1 Tax=Dimargaris cristalligena TaxID=215637 RepID=A0A4P9ZZH7_9FUNG|nr:hypothetical protein H4R33_003229 [Dimargaris cristalligena]RKP39186.1 hypothetical protein BJ085DRAFT_41578 [Dimargaris cristalligena]|eukprot:RKP39186.1 hypothetical protein BJ085DRAFT_41578 [Dimargaris cristalligena]
MRAYNVAILVVSDSVSQGKSVDQTAALLQAELAITPAAPSDTTLTFVETRCVPDDIHVIQRVVKEWTDPDAIPPVQLILTTGGTGLSARDVTPEAIEPLLDRTCLGFTVAMLTHSLSITPMATLSRPVCGVRHQSLIITLPGKPKAAVENFQVVRPSLSHALDLIQGLSSRELHRQLENTKLTAVNPPKEHRCTAHRHHHRTPSTQTSGGATGAQIPSAIETPVAFRPRESPFPLVTVPQAEAIIRDHLKILPIETVPVGPALIGRTLAQDIVAPVPVPAYRASIVDGYALLAICGPGVYPVTPYPSLAGTLLQELPMLPVEHIMRISTGAPVPPGADAVVMVEDTELIEVAADNREEQSVAVHARCQSGENIREIGSDIAQGQVVLGVGDSISVSGAELGTLMSLGITQVQVYRLPVVGVFSTGSELSSAESTPSVLPAGKIRDSNRPSLIGILQQHGFPVVDLGIVDDSTDAVSEFLRRHTESQGIDVLVSSGGVSMGEKDVLKSVIQHGIGARIHFGRVNMRPGKPTVFATLGTDPAAVDYKLLFALPGNPVSAIVTCYLYVLPSLRRMARQAAPDNPRLQAKLQQSLTLDARPEFHRGIVMAHTPSAASPPLDNGYTSTMGRPTVASEVHFPAPLVVWSATRHQRSSRLMSFRHSNCLLVLPAHEADRSTLEAGETVEVVLLDTLWNTHTT